MRERTQNRRKKARVRLGEAGMYFQGILVRAHILETEAGVE